MKNTNGSLNVNALARNQSILSKNVKSVFYFNQIVIATCRNEAKFGTITTHSEKHFYRWADPYPRTVDDLEHGDSGPNDQQRLVAGMLDRDNLLDLVRTFTLFATDDKGETIKIVGRYQQKDRHQHAHTAGSRRGSVRNSAERVCC